MPTKLSPLAPNVPIVDQDGNPTPYFQRMLDLWLKEKAVAEGDLAAVITDVTQIQTDLTNFTLDELSDVDVSTTPPDDGQTIIWDNTNSEWIPGDASGGGGALDYIGSTTLTAATNIDIALPSGYDSYDVEFYFDPSTDNISYSAVFTADNFGTTLTGATDYSYVQHRASNGSAGVSNSNGAASISFLVAGQGNDANEYNAGVLRIINSKDTAPTEVIGHFKYVTTTANVSLIFLEASYKPTTVLNGIRITPSSGTVTGFVKVWGRKLSPAVALGAMTLLDSHTFTGSETTHTFSSISGAYKDLILVFNGRSDRAAQVLSQMALRFNADTTAANYYSQNINASSATVNASATAGTQGYLLPSQLPAATAPAGYNSLWEVTIGGYSGTVFHKQVKGDLVFAQAATAAGHTEIRQGGHWLSTSAITSITIFDTNTANFTSGSTVYLYGRA